MAEPDVVVIGAGAAGIFAACRAAELGAKVLLLEKTARIGTKILISGGGKCNIGHAGTIDQVLSAFRPEEARFIRPACYRLRNDQIVQRFTDRGLQVMTRPDGRIFPVEQTAKDVVRILQDTLDEAGVELRLNAPVEKIEAVEGRIAQVYVGGPPAPHRGYAERTPGGFGATALLRQVLTETVSPRRIENLDRVISASRVVVSVGGSSYPNSGTTGDGFQWMRNLGHRIEPVRAALAPIYLDLPDRWPPGVALRSCRLKARQDGKEIARWDGDLLFTHQGISGPVALGISRAVAERIDHSAISLEVDIRPDAPFETITAELVDLAASHPKRAVRSYLESVLPDSLVLAVFEAADVDPAMLFSRLDRSSRNRLITMLKALPLGQVRAVPLEKGEVVAGGVSRDEVDPQTMRSRLVQGLYLCGEVLDVAGPVGGYNLHAAFATGYVAGETAAKDALG